MPEEHDFTPDEIVRLKRLAHESDKVLIVSDTFDKSQWAGKLFWKIGVAIGGTVAFWAAFKEHILSYFAKG